MSQTLSSLLWHDGNLLNMSFAIDAKGMSSVSLRVLLYSNNQESKRSEFQVECEGVSRFSSSLDAIELKDNMSAGNISNGYLKDKTLWLYLTDGCIEIHAKKFRLSAR